MYCNSSEIGDRNRAAPDGKVHPQALLKEDGTPTGGLAAGLCRRRIQASIESGKSLNARENVGGTLAMIQEFSISRLLFLRKVTRAVSDFLVSELKGHLNTISPLLRPRRLLGDYIESGSPEQVVDADKNFTVLSEVYAKAAGKPFDLPRPLRPPLKPIGLALEIYPWERLCEIQSSGIKKAITITSPVRYVITYASGLSLSRLRQGVAGKEEHKKEDVREFVIRCCLIHSMLAKNTNIINLFRALRWEVSTETSPDLGGLPLTTLTAPIQSILPPESLILESTEMSGMPLFEEVVDVEALPQIQDPLISKIESIIEAASAG
jgi:hypothetical protein